MLVGWFLAVQTCMYFDAGPSRAPVSAAVEEKCETLDLSDLTGALTRGQIDCLEIRAKRAEDKMSSGERYWRSMWAWSAAGAIGATLTAIGAPVATRRPLSLIGLLAAVSVGAAVAAGWFGVVGTVFPDAPPGSLFVPWQAAVAAVIGRWIG